MANDWLDTYRFWLGLNRELGRDQEKEFAYRSLVESIQGSAAYQANALCNGISQPIIATRSNTRQCKVSVLPGNTMCIGDLIYVFNEYWICMELYTDEYDLTYGELWLCNQVFKYQDGDGKIFQKHAILDDGSYSKGNDKAIPVTNNTFNCYVSMDDDSKALFIDKRLAIDTIYDENGEQIIDVGKICWVDSKSRNFGKGSHLLVFGLSDDVYNKEKDRIDLMICDYIVESPKLESTVNLYIEGREKIRIGTGRTYKVFAVDTNGNSTTEGLIAQWSVVNPTEGVTLSRNGDYDVTLSVPLDDSLIGSTITIECIDESGAYPDAQKEVEVISIG